MSNNFYISDPHFGHFNIIRYDDRPFRTLYEMEEVLTENWNKRVRPEDTTYILGDVSWLASGHDNRAILNSLNGKKILIRGNHDKQMQNCRDCFEEIRDYARIMDNGIQVILFHYPIAFWDGQFHDSVHLYGHVHNSHQWHMYESWMKEGRALQAIPMRAYNVGVMMDYMDYGPRTLKEIILAHPLEALDK